MGRASRKTESLRVTGRNQVSSARAEGVKRTQKAEHRCPAAGCVGPLAEASWEAWWCRGRRPASHNGKPEVPSAPWSAIPAGCGPGFSCVLMGALRAFKLCLTAGTASPGLVRGWVGGGALWCDAGTADPHGGTSDNEMGVACPPCHHLGSSSSTFSLPGAPQAPHLCNEEATLTDFWSFFKKIFWRHTLSSFRKIKSQ